ncbi:MAG: DUF1385 domain-containing protein, partial [Clostridiales bacterium]
MSKKISYGGQAVMEGVMMQGPGGKAIACRKENGEIALKVTCQSSWKDRFPFMKWPILRGFFSFCESMLNGIQDLTWSAAQIGESDEEKLTTKEIVFAVGVALILVMVFFVGVPVLLATYARPYIGDFGRSLLEGILRAGFFIGYVVLISRMEDIQRLFSYHGAEHKTIATYEAGEIMTVENARKYSTIHVRCGTSFILMTMILMVVIFTFVGQTGAWSRIGIKLLMMPLVAGLAYELFRLPLRFPNSRLVHILVTPGLWMQKLTTKEPDDSQLAVAIAAMTNVPGFPSSQIEVKDQEKDDHQAEA